MCPNSQKIIIRAALNPISLNLATEEELKTVSNIETINFPIEEQQWILSHRDDYIKQHPNTQPNVLVIQDDVLLSYNFPRDIIQMNPKDRPKWFSGQFTELSEKLKSWQGKMLFEWAGMKIYNRGHVIGNRDFTLIFLEVS